MNELMESGTHLWEGGRMGLEENQIKNTRNRLVEFIRQTTPETLIRVAILLKVKVPKELIDKYISSSPD